MRHSDLNSRRLARPLLALCVAAAGLLPAVTGALALPGDDIDSDPINYSKTAATDPVSNLQERVAKGTVKLQKGSHGYLESVLRGLDIPVSSQVLVYSKTSFQRDRISPSSPRALYFNDDVYIGWVQGGTVLEVSAADPQLGATFYVLEQDSTAPKFVRQSYECLSCHASSLTGGYPGHTIRSVYTGRDGQPLLAAGTFITTDESPMEQRFGGWYVTGTHGEQYHMGNLFVRNTEEADNLDRSRGANVLNLKKFFDTSAYLTPHSDLVALMVLQHQVNVHNLITRAGYDTRRALHFEKLLNRDLGRPEGFRSDSTASRIRAGCEPLVKGLLFADAAPLAGPIRGTSTFAADFSRRGVRDRQGRSLKDLDLKTRLFRFPCSYLIYSEAFNALPAEAKAYVYGRLWDVLDGKDPGQDFKNLTPADRETVRDILVETKPEFAAARPKA